MATQISAKEVSELRAKTGAGMMDCKKALLETGGDLEKAVDFLKQKGVARAEKRAGRAAKEGIIGNYLHFNGKVGVLVELNCETDFVARTDDFQELARDLAMHIASAKPMAVDAAGMPEDVVARERAIFEKQVEESGKPEAAAPHKCGAAFNKYISRAGGRAGGRFNEGGRNNVVLSWPSQL